MNEPSGYLFKNERDFDDSKYAGRFARSINLKPEDFPYFDNIKSSFVKITAIREDTDDKQATGIDVEWNAETREFEEPEGATVYDSDEVEAGETFGVTTDIISSQSLEVDEIVEVFFYPDKSDTQQWMARKPSGGGSSGAVLKLKSVSSGEYTVDIMTDFSGETVLEANAKAKILSGTTSNDSTIIGEKYISLGTEVEIQGTGESATEVTIHYFQPPVVF